MLAQQVKDIRISKEGAEFYGQVGDQAIDFAGVFFKEPPVSCVRGHAGRAYAHLKAAFNCVAPVEPKVDPAASLHRR